MREFISLQMLALLAINPGSRVSFRLSFIAAPPGKLARAPDEWISASPAATSHSCLGESVQVASASPAATSANLYATDPVGRIAKFRPSKRAHSPRLNS